MRCPLPCLVPLAAALVVAQEPIPSPPDAVVVSATSGLTLLPDATLRGGGAAYRVHCDARALRFEPALGLDVAATQFVTLSPQAVRRGEVEVVVARASAPGLVDRCAVRGHDGGIEEHLDVRPDGVAVSWHFPQPLPGSGELVVRYALATSLSVRRADGAGGVRFELPTGAGVAIGGVTGIDATGARVTGALRCGDGWLEMALPADFVAAAAYPLVLDPVVSTISAGSAAAGASDFDVAYDAGTNSWLVVWNVPISANDSDIRGQRLLNGSLWGSLIAFNNTGVAACPRVANVRERGRFGVVWRQTIGAGHTVQFRAVTASTGAVTHSLSVASSPSDAFGQIDIAGEGSLAIDVTADFLVVYHDQQLDAIRTRRISFLASDTMLSPPANDLWTNGVPTGATYAWPNISRCSGDDGNLLTTVTRALAGVSSVHCAGISVSGIAASVVGELPLPPASTNPYYRADVDGAQGRWSVAAINQIGFADVMHVDWTAIGQLVFAPPQPYGFGGMSASAPKVARSSARGWCLSGIQSAVSYSTFDSTSPAQGNEPPANLPGALDPEGAVASTASGAMPQLDDAVVAFRITQSQLMVAFLRSHANGGTITNLGGACGTAATTSFSGNPAIGSNGFTCSVAGLSPTTVAAVFNFATAGSPFACGPCTFTPWQITMIPPLVAGGASVRFPLPPRANLIGLQFETQWTGFDLAQSPCPILPAFVATNRSLLTLGQ